jgi:flavin-dependent dehydrogenase
MLRGQLGLDSGYVVQKVVGMRTFVAGQAVKETAAPGYVIRRDLFDQALADAAVQSGAELRCATRATAINTRGEVTLTPKEGPAFSVRPQVIIGADGPHSTVGSWVGAVNRGLIPGVQQTLPLVAPLTHTEIYFDPEITAGYGWLFPKGQLANVGLGMLPPTEGNLTIRRMLDRFVSRLSDQGKICGSAVGHAAGWIPVEPMRSALYGNILLVGAAAGHSHPITGAGVFAAVTCGRMAGEYAARAVAAGTLALLSSYDQEWQDLLGNTLALARKRREQMETHWSDFPSIVRRSWVAFREYYV